MMNLSNHNWQTLNLNALQQRLSWLHKQPEGIIYNQPSGSQVIAVKKLKSFLILLLADRKTLTTNVVQSILDLNHPLNFALPYPQAVMLALTWKRRPKKIYIVGFGGGTIPMFFYHYFAEAIIECTDIDSKVIEVAQKFFGVQLDNRLKVTLQDGRDYLSQQNPNIKYDIIITDAGLGSGSMPYHLVTQEFYHLCQTHLSEDGVLVAHLFHQPTFTAAALNTIKTVFSQVYLCPLETGNLIVLATNSPPLDKKEIFARAEQLQDFHHLSFSLIKKALQLQSMTEWQKNLPNLEPFPIWQDADPPVGYFDQ